MHVIEWRWGGGVGVGVGEEVQWVYADEEAAAF